MKRWLAQQIGHWLEKRNLLVLFRIDGSAIGDLVTATAYMRLAHARHGVRFIVVSKYPALFENNPQVAINVNFRQLGPFYRPLVKWVLRRLEHPRLFSYAYNGGKPTSHERYMADHCRPVSLMQMLSERSVFPVSYADTTPVFFFTPDEESAFAAKFGLTEKSYAVIKPCGYTGWSPNREWVFERFQAVVDAFPDICWVQDGTPSDPLLAGVIDLRGKTNLRELALLIRHARFILATEGLPNHLAAAFGTLSFVIFSGVYLPELALYPCTQVIARRPPTDCTPCWLTSPCPLPGRPCTQDIQAEDVIACLRATLGLPVAPSGESI